MTIYDLFLLLSDNSALVLAGFFSIFATVLIVVILRPKWHS